MSIAVSVIIRPSRALMLCVTAFACCLLTVAALLWVQLAGNIPDHDRWILSAVCAKSAIALFLLSYARRNTYRLDLSGSGQIRLTQYKASATARENADGSGEVVHLIGDSTLWPMLMLLRLQLPSGRVLVVSVLPDSLERDAFRVVYVACRWIAAQDMRVGAGEKHSPID